MALGRVVIVGRPNVGKSQLFNRLTGRKHSVVYSEPGITRDRLELEVEWFGRRFLLMDTGGYTTDRLTFQEEINRQTEIALREADMVLFMVSGKEGLTPEDRHLARVLRRRRVPNVLLVANKCDVADFEDSGFHGLGFGEPLPISAEHGINTGPLLERIVAGLGIREGEEAGGGRYRIAIIGRPNVGKSSLVNALLGEERVITSEVAGTTRDAVDLDFEHGGRPYRLIDTPGIRRPASLGRDEAERFSVLRSRKAVERADMVWLVLDMSEEPNELDERIGGIIHRANIPSIMVVNKCDLAAHDPEGERRRFLRTVRTKFKFLDWSPVVFVSALRRRGLTEIFRRSDLIREEVRRRVPPHMLREFMHRISLLYSVPNVSGRKIRLFSLSQKEGQVPTFLFLCSDPDTLHFSYSRLVERQIRECFGFRTCPITVIYKKK